MKKLFIPAFVAVCLFLACKNTAEKTQKEENVQSENERQTSQPPATTKLCFLTTGKDLQRGDRVIRDSTILTLEVTGKQVTGIFKWFPAEKDGRSGTLKGTLADNQVRGKYTFIQEGMTETQDILIKMTEEQAKITTNQGKHGEFVLTAQKVDCK